jgi:hypothetical protein
VIEDLGDRIRQGRGLGVKPGDASEKCTRCSSDPGSSRE